MIAALGVLLFLFFYTSLPTNLALLFWMLSATADLSYMWKYHRLISHEKNPILRNLAVYMPLWAAACTAFCVEAVLIIIVAPFVLAHRWDPATIGLAGLLAGAVHIAGLVESNGFIRRRNLTDQKLK